MRQLASGVLATAQDFSRWVVCDDGEVAQFALLNGAQVVWRSGGLNRAVQDAVDHLGAEGFGRVIVTHGDIANPGGFGAFAGPPVLESNALSIGSDRHGDGSNVVSIPTGVGFQFAYGPGSFARHVAEAQRCGIPVERADDPSLQLDVDTPEDLALYRGGQ